MTDLGLIELSQVQKPEELKFFFAKLKETSPSLPYGSCSQWPLGIFSSKAFVFNSPDLFHSPNFWTCTPP